jgi:hypothetical protein
MKSRDGVQLISMPNRSRINVLKIAAVNSIGENLGMNIADEKGENLDSEMKMERKCSKSDDTVANKKGENLEKMHE